MLGHSCETPWLKTGFARNRENHGSVLHILGGGRPRIFPQPNEKLEPRRKTIFFFGDEDLDNPGGRHDKMGSGSLGKEATGAWGGNKTSAHPPSGENSGVQKARKMASFFGMAITIHTSGSRSRIQMVPERQLKPGML